MCTHTRQVEHQHCSRTGRVQENNNILRKKTIFKEHPVPRDGTDINCFVFLSPRIAVINIILQFILSMAFCVCKPSSCKYKLFVTYMDSMSYFSVFASRLLVNTTLAGFVCVNEDSSI